MKELVIFCEAHVVIENALYVLLRNCDSHSITVVIPGNYDLLKFFKVVNERVFKHSINIIYFEPYTGRKAEAGTLKERLHLILDVRREKQYLKEVFDEYFANIKNADVYFFSRVANPVTFYIIQRLSRDNKLIYMYYATYPDQAEEYSPNNIIGFLSLFRMKLVYGRAITLGKLRYTKGFAYIPDSYLEKKVDILIDYKRRNELMKGFDLSQFRVFDIENYRVIYFDQPLVESGRITDASNYQRELDEIFTVLAKHFKDEEIAYKYHPNSSADKVKIGTGRLLPEFIPAEFCYSDKVMIYLSTVSCAIANVEKGNAISLANLVTFKSDELRENLKETLVRRSRSKILFPKTLDELESMFIDIKRQKVDS